MRGEILYRLSNQLHCVALLLAAVTLAATARADSTWTGGGTDNLWATPANWSDNAVPGDNATIRAVDGHKTIDLGSAESTITGTLSVGEGSEADPIILTASDGGKLQSAVAEMGYGSSTESHIKIAGGTIKTTGNFYTARTATNAKVEMTGGTLDVGGEFTICDTTGANGEFSLVNGTINVASWLCIGRNGNNRTAKLTIGSGGTLSHTGNSLVMGNLAGSNCSNEIVVNDGGTLTTICDVYIGENSSGTLTINGGLVHASATDSGSRWVYMNQNNGGYDSTINLNGGILEVGSIKHNKASSGGAAATINFNGGTMHAYVADGSGWIQSANNLNLKVLSGGAKFDVDSGISPTIHPALVSGVESGTDGGLTKLGDGTLILNQNPSYTGKTTVEAGALTIKFTEPLSASASALGDVEVKSGATLNLDFSALQLIPGTYTIFSGTTFDGTVTTVNPTVSSGYTFTFERDTTTTAYTLTVAASPVWTGATSASWSEGGNWSSSSAPTDAAFFFESSIGTGGSKTVNLGSTAQSITGAMYVNAGTAADPLIMSAEEGGSLAASGAAYVGFGAGTSGYLKLNSGTYTFNNLLIGNTDATGTVVVEDGVTLNETANDPYIGNGGTGTLTINGGTVWFGNASSAKWTKFKDGTLNLNGGELKVCRLVRDSGSPVINFNGGTVVSYNAGNNKDNIIENDGGWTLNIKTGGAKFNIPNGLATTINQPFVSADESDGGLEKLGEGTLVLATVPTYNGKTKVSAGALTIKPNAALSASSAMLGELVVESGTTLTVDLSAITPVEGTYTLFSKATASDVTISPGTEHEAAYEYAKSQSDSAVVLTVTKYVAQVEGVKYTTLQAAIDATATATDKTITLLADTEEVTLANSTSVAIICGSYTANLIVNTASGYVLTATTVGDVTTYTSVANSASEWRDTSGDHAWNTAANWSTGVVPTQYTDVTIPSGTWTIKLNHNSGDTRDRCKSLTVNGDVTFERTASSTWVCLTLDTANAIEGTGAITLNMAGLYNNTTGNIEIKTPLVTTGNTLANDSLLTGSTSERTWTVSGNVTVNANSYFKVEKSPVTISGNLSVADGASIGCKDSDGTMTVTGTTVLNGELKWGKDGANSDKCVGILTLGAVTLAADAALYNTSGIKLDGTVTIADIRTLTLGASNVLGANATLFLAGVDSRLVVSDSMGIDTAKITKDLSGYKIYSAAGETSGTTVYRIGRVASIGEGEGIVYYESLQAAVDAAAASGTMITVHAAGASESATVKSAKSFAVAAADGVTLSITISGGEEYENTSGTDGTYTFTNKAATFYWTGNDGDWSNVANWALGSASGTAATRLPGNIDNVNFNAGGIVNMGSSFVTVKDWQCINTGLDKILVLKADADGGLKATDSHWPGLEVGREGDSTVVFDSGSYSLLGGNKGLYVGWWWDNETSRIGQVDITNAAINVGYVEIGTDHGRGTLNIDGTGSLNVNGDIRLGTGTTLSEGRLNLKNGTVSFTGSTQVGRGVATSENSIDGFSYGMMTVSGGTVSGEGKTLYVGNEGGKGELEISGGTINVAKFSPGTSTDLFGGTEFATTVGGTGTVYQTAGTVNMTDYMPISNGTGSYGKYTITGGNLTVGGGNPVLVVGRIGDGEMEVSEAEGSTTIVTVGSVQIAEQAGGVKGRLSISGGTFTSNGHIKLGEGANADATLVISGGSVKASNINFGANATSKAAFTFTGGTLETGYFSSGSSTQKTIVLDGGTFKAKQKHSNFFNGQSATIGESGFTFDTAGYNVTINMTGFEKSGSTTKIVKTGSGTLTLGGEDTLDSGLIVSNGVLNINSLAVSADCDIALRIGRANYSSINLTACSRSNDAKLKVTPILDSDDLPYPGTKFLVISGLGDAFTETSQFENAASGYPFTEEHDGDSTTFDIYSYTWEVSGGNLYLTVDYNASAIGYATWKGGASGSLSDAANWTCTTIGGTTLAWATPSAYTTILFTNDASSWALPDLSGFDYLGVMAKASDIVLSADADWSAYEVEFADGAKVNLNNHTLTLGTYFGGNTVGGAEFTDTHEDADAENPTFGTLVLGAGNGVMHGNEKVKFSGKLKVKVTGNDDTPFQTTVANTHTGGWIFKDNNSAVQLRYDTHSMGTGPVVFDGNGGFSSCTTGGNFYETAVRQIYVNGTGNRHVTTISVTYHEFLRYANFHGDENAELIISGNNTTETASNAHCWDDFTGTITLDGVKLLHWSETWPENVTFKLKNGGDLQAREANKTITVGKIILDFSANGQTATLSQWYSTGTTTWAVKTLEEDPEYTGTLNVAGRMVFPESSTASIKLGSTIAITGEGESDVSNLAVTIAETPTVSTTLMTAAGTITGAPSYSNPPWEIVPDIDSKALVLQNANDSTIEAYLEGVAARTTETLPSDWVTANLTGEGKPFEGSRAKAIAALRNGTLAANGIPYTWCYALGLSTTDATDKPTLASAATASGWELSAAGITVPDALKDTVKIKSEVCADPDFNGEKKYGTAAAYNQGVTITITDIKSNVRYFRIVFDVAE